MVKKQGQPGLIWKQVLQCHRSHRQSNILQTWWIFRVHFDLTKCQNTVFVVPCLDGNVSPYHTSTLHFVRIFSSFISDCSTKLTFDVYLQKFFCFLVIFNVFLSNGNVMLNSWAWNRNSSIVTVIWGPWNAFTFNCTHEFFRNNDAHVKSLKCEVCEREWNRLLRLD